MVYLVTANVKSNPVMRQSYVESDINKVKGFGGVIIWQEIAPDRYTSAIARLLPGKDWDTKHLGTEVPISLKKEYWQVIDFGIKVTHHGRKAVTPTRFITWVKAKRRGTNKVVIFVNTHFVSSAFSNRHPLTKAWRLERWNHHYKMLQEMVIRWNKAGYTVVGGGDWNRGTTPKFTKNQRWLARAGIDHLFVCEAPQGVKVQLIEMDVEPLHSDHDAKRAYFNLVKGKDYRESTINPAFDDLKSL